MQLPATSADRYADAIAMGADLEAIAEELALPGLPRRRRATCFNTGRPRCTAAGLPSAKLGAKPGSPPYCQLIPANPATAPMKRRHEKLEPRLKVPSCHGRR